MLLTGFGSAVGTYGSKKFTFEIKSLNSKQMDLTVRIPSGYRQLEADVRNVAARRLERGKVELTMHVETTDESGAVQLNLPALLGLPQPDDWYATLLRFPDAVKSDTVEEISGEERDAVMQALDAALDSICAYRAVEGKKLEEFFGVRIARIADLLAEVPRYETERLVKIRTRITDGLASIPKVDYDKGRLEQEMIFYIEKLDINEEKQRLRQHLDYFLETLAGPQGQGKKLGFIAQEMGREINTMGSKSNHAEMQILVVKMKDELEQIKEQVLNAM